MLNLTKKVKHSRNKENGPCLSSKHQPRGQVVIPAEFRETIGLRPGAKVLVSLAGDRRVVVEPIPDDPIEAACGMLQGGPSLTRALLKERREEYAREGKQFARFVRHGRLPQQRTRVRKG
ncbi:MAG: AbrB/MazE/SpoVT family DNA-binding domain-containing protein [Acidobacteria bacterium]|nr:AbrB/MazE/SpoVT family DNA-binding domain-containing protein [Acidobacteriota bacterium]